MADRHIVLTKPGDILLISNVGQAPVVQMRRLGEAFRTLGIDVVCLAADIDLTRVDIGPDDCGCGGCASCAQHDLLRQLGGGPGFNPTREHGVRAGHHGPADDLSTGAPSHTPL